MCHFSFKLCHFSLNLCHHLIADFIFEPLNAHQSAIRWEVVQLYWSRCSASTSRRRPAWCQAQHHARNHWVLSFTSRNLSQNMHFLLSSLRLSFNLGRSILNRIMGHSFFSRNICTNKMFCFNPSSILYQDDHDYLVGLYKFAVSISWCCWRTMTNVHEFKLTILNMNILV